MEKLLLISLICFFTSCSSATKMDKTPAKRTSLIDAVKNGRHALVEAELKRGADVNTKDDSNKSLLLLATITNDLQMAKLLVTHGADVNQQDNQLDSPFLLAGALGHAALITLFLSNGARFDLFNRYNGTALIPACERGHTDVVRILARTKGFPIDHVNRLGWTALMEAVVLGNGSAKYVEIVKILVDAGCNTSIPDRDGVTALQQAQSRGFAGITAVLSGKR
jgi:ankyrin repeat protein